MRDALARTLYEIARHDPRVVVLVADISPAGAMEDFRREFPDRFINVGVAEQAMVGLAAGLAQRGYRPFCYTIATFALFRTYEFIRCDLAYQNLPVTVVGMGAGLSYSTLGGTHQATEDVAVAMACPNLTVLAPCDPAETAACVIWCASRDAGGPVYLRIGKAGEPDFELLAAPWEFGRMRWLRRDSSARGSCFVTYGPIVREVVEAAMRYIILTGEPTSVVVASTLTDISMDDEAALFGYERVFVVEEASGAPLARLIRAAVDARGPSEVNCPAAEVLSICLPSDFVHFYGTRAELLDHVGLTAEKIVAQIRQS